jgi:hypothetical protein
MLQKLCGIVMQVGVVAPRPYGYEVSHPGPGFGSYRVLMRCFFIIVRNGAAGVKGDSAGDVGTACKPLKISVEAQQL